MIKTSNLNIIIINILLCIFSMFILNNTNSLIISYKSSLLIIFLGIKIISLEKVIKYKYEK